MATPQQLSTLGAVMRAALASESDTNILDDDLKLKLDRIIVSNPTDLDAIREFLSGQSGAYTIAIAGTTLNVDYGFVAQIGVQLTASASGWGGSEPSSVSWQWYDGDGAISGANTSTYTPVTDDNLAVIYATATPVDGGYSAQNSASYTVRHPYPAPGATLPDVVYAQAEGTETIDASGIFTETADGAYTIEPTDSFVEVDSAGEITVTKDDAQADTEVTVIYTNSGGVGRSGFTVRVESGGESAVLDDVVVDDIDELIFARASHTGTVYAAMHGVEDTPSAPQIMAGSGGGITEAWTFPPSTTAYVDEYTSSSGGDGDDVMVSFYLDPDEGGINDSAIIRVPLTLQFAVPAAITKEDFTVTSTGVSGTLLVTPNVNPPTTTGYKYKVDGGSAVDTSDIVPFEISSLTDDVNVTITLIPYNENGDGPETDADPVAPNDGSSASFAYIQNLYDNTAKTTYTWADRAEGNLYALISPTDKSVTASTINSNATTSLFVTGGSYGRVSFRSCADADGATLGTVSATFSGSQIRANAKGMWLRGFDLSAAYDTAQDMDLGGGTGSCTVSCEAGGIIIAISKSTTGITGLANVEAADSGIQIAWEIFAGAQTDLAIATTTGGTNGSLSVIALSPES